MSAHWWDNTNRLVDVTIWGIALTLLICALVFHV